jgi:hypothetical protein
MYPGRDLKTGHPEYETRVLSLDRSIKVQCLGGEEVDWMQLNGGLMLKR